MMKLQLNLIKILSLKNHNTPVDSLVYLYNNNKENV